MLAALVRGSWRQYWAVFLYMACLTVTSVAEIAVLIEYGLKSTQYAYCYWCGELLRQTTLYVTIVSLLLQAIPASRVRATMLRLLVTVAVIFWVGSLWVYQQPSFSPWMARVVRNLAFCSSIVNLGLWFALIASEKRHSQLLMITGGLGLQMTGEAIGLSLRHVSGGKATMLGNFLATFTHWLCLYIWWRAFQPQTALKLEQKTAA